MILEAYPHRQSEKVGEALLGEAAPIIITVAPGESFADALKANPSLPLSGYNPSKGVAIRWPAPGAPDAGKPVVEKRPIDLARQPHQRMSFWVNRYRASAPLFRAEQPPPAAIGRSAELCSL